MGLPTFIWWGVQQGRIGGTESPRNYFSLPDELSDLQITQRRDVQDVYSIAGGRSRTMTRSWLDVRIVYERFNDDHTIRRLYTMIDHLSRGGCISFALDPAFIWGNRCSPTMEGKAVSVRSEKPFIPTYIDPPNIWKHLHPDAPDVMPQLDANGQPVTLELEDGHPRAARARVRISTTADAAYVDYSSGRREYAVSNPLCDFPAGSHVRHRDFFPKLYLPQSQVGSPMLTHDHRISYTLDLRLTYKIPDNEIFPVKPQQESAIGNMTSTLGRDPSDFDLDKLKVG